MTELTKYIGPDLDVPSMGYGVGLPEVGEEPMYDVSRICLCGQFFRVLHERVTQMLFRLQDSVVCTWKGDETFNKMWGVVVLAARRKQTSRNLRPLGRAAERLSMVSA